MSCVPVASRSSEGCPNTKTATMHTILRHPVKGYEQAQHASKHRNKGVWRTPGAPSARARAGRARRVERLGLQPCLSPRVTADCAHMAQLMLLLMLLEQRTVQRAFARVQGGYRIKWIDSCANWQMELLPRAIGRVRIVWHGT